MLKLFAASLMIISTNLLAGEPASAAKPSLTPLTCPDDAPQLVEPQPLPKSVSALAKCQAREIAVYTGDEKRSWSEAFFGSSCYKWVPGGRSHNTALIRKCHADQEFRALIIKQYCEKKTKGHDLTNINNLE